MAQILGYDGSVHKKKRHVAALRIQSAINGTPIAIVYGQVRCAGTGIWTGGFASQKNSSGKGLGSGKASQTTYTADIIFGICEGPATALDAWSNNTPHPLGGTNGLNFTEFAGTPGQVPWSFMSSNFASAALGYNLLCYVGADPFNLGSSPSMPNLTYEVRGAVSGAVTETYTIASPYTFIPVNWNLSAAATETCTIPPLSPFTYQATNYKAQGSVPVVIGNLGSPVGTQGNGVIDINGNVYARVASGPASGQYSVSSTGLYTFNAANANTQVTVIDFAASPGVHYVYQASGTATAGSANVTGVTVPAGAAAGQLVTSANFPVGTFAQSISGTTVTMSQNALTSGTANLTFWGAALQQVLASPAAGQFAVSVQPAVYGQYQFSSADTGSIVGILDIVDANPADVALDFLTNPQYGVGFPVANIGSLSELRNYTGASGLFISSAIATQQDANGFLHDLADGLNGAFVWSGSTLTWKSYGDVPVSGYGYTWSPSLAPVYSFTDDDFMASSGSALVGSSSFTSADPVVTAYKSPKNIVNDVKITFLDRGNSYNPGVAEAMDDASIAFWGRKPGNGKQFDFFCIDSAAAVSASLQLGREQVLRQFGFTVPWYYALLDPMDIVALTESNTGLNAQSCRVIEITENQNDSSLSFLVEELSQGTGTPATFSKQASGGYAPNQNVPAPATNTPILFTAPFAVKPSLSVGIVLSGVPGWGGCNVYVSTDGSTYSQIGTVNTPCNQGTLTATYPPGSDPDTTDTLSIDLTESDGSVISGSQSDADQFNTLSIVDSELIAYSAVTPTGTYTFNLGTYIRRGVYGTTIAAHSSGAPFARLDQNVFYYQIPNQQLGSALYFKFPSFNVYGGGQQSLASATAYTYTIPGPPLPGAVQNFTAQVNGLAVALSWTDLTAAGIKGYDISWGPQGGSYATSTSLTQASRQTAETTVGIPPGSQTVYIAAVDNAGQLGPASSANVTVPNNNAVIKVIASELDWLGTKNGYVLHPTGVLIPDSTVLASALTVAQLFTSFVPKPVANPSYTTPTFDGGFNANLRVWFNSSANKGPGVADAPVLGASLDDWTAGNSDPGTYVPWSIGSINAEYVKGRITDSSPTPGVLTQFDMTVDAQTQTYTFNNVAVANTGTTDFNYAANNVGPFHTLPNVQATPSDGVGSSAGASTTLTDATLQEFSGATLIAGTVNLSISGV